jgi:hypothetical protein
MAMSKDDEAIRELSETRYPGGFTVRDEANALVALAFRNGPIEDLHAGKRSDLLENPELSRITDHEMKRIMLAACECLERLLRLRHDDPRAYNRKIIKANLDYCGKWDR